MNEEEIPLVVEEEIENLYSKIEYLVKRVDEIYDVLVPKKIEEVVVEEKEVTPLDTTVYKAKIIQDKELVMIQVGKLNDLGVLELYEVETQAPIVPNLYQPEFYYIGLNEILISETSQYINTPKPKYIKFVPKNINQILITKDGIDFTTGYINENGVAIYYDQLPQKISE